jgi:hypothetical protein
LYLARFPVLLPIDSVVALSDRFDLLRAVVVLGFFLFAAPIGVDHLRTHGTTTGAFYFLRARQTAVIPSIVSDRELLAANAISSITGRRC